jgi:hypothetical protein
LTTYTNEEFCRFCGLADILTDAVLIKQCPVIRKAS